MKSIPLLVLLACCALVPAQSGGVVLHAPPPASKPGVKAVQSPFASLKPAASLKVGATADWVAITDRAVWITATKPNSVQRIDPATKKIVAKIRVPAEACSGLAAGFGSIWVPLCGKMPKLLRIDELTNQITDTLAISAADSEGGIAASSDSIWLVTDRNGTLARIDPATNSVRQKIIIPPGSYNPAFDNGVVWVTGFDSSLLTAVNATTGEVLARIPVGPHPRFLAAGGGAVWTLNQGDGSISRVDEKSKTLTATILAGIPGQGGDLCYGADSVWASVFDVPLTRIDGQSGTVVRQWIGVGGDALRFGHNSIWITDYHHGLVMRFPIQTIQDAIDHPIPSWYQP